VFGIRVLRRPGADPRRLQLAVVMVVRRRASDVHRIAPARAGLGLRSSGCPGTVTVTASCRQAFKLPRLFSLADPARDRVARAWRAWDPSQP
jgi:hypothetical protein